jgi:hypothetical protein
MRHEGRLRRFLVALAIIGITLAVGGAIAVAVYAASGGAATAMVDLAYLFMGLAVPVGLAVFVIGLVVSRIRRNRGGSTS